MPKFDVAIDQLWGRAWWLLGLTTLYVATYFPLFQLFELSAAIFVTLPVIAAAWFYGARAGTAVGLLTFPINMMLALYVGGVELGRFLDIGGVTGSAAEVLVGFVVGHVSELRSELVPTGVID